MQILQPGQTVDCGETAVALGTFDGLHIGHQKIIDNARAAGEGLPLLVYSFANIPAAYFGKPVKAIYSREEKIRIFQEFGVDYLQLVPFDESVMNMAPLSFLDYLTDRLHARVISCGFNYTFGLKAQGTPELLMDYAEERGISAIVSPPVVLGDKPVSSTLIRKALKEGDIISANIMLGKSYSISGVVQHGKHLGRTLNFPTINIPIPDEKLCPRAGVYATSVEVDGTVYPAMTNIGVRPTVENTEIPNSETYLIGFAGDLYGRLLKVNFSDYIRPEYRFSGVEALCEQLQKDEKTALQKHLQLI